MKKKKINENIIRVIDNYPKKAEYVNDKGWLFTMTEDGEFYVVSRNTSFAGGGGAITSYYYPQAPYFIDVFEGLFRGGNTPSFFIDELFKYFWQKYAKKETIYL